MTFIVLALANRSGAPGVLLVGGTVYLVGFAILLAPPAGAYFKAGVSRGTK